MEIIRSYADIGEAELIVVRGTETARCATINRYQAWRYRRNAPLETGVGHKMEFRSVA